MEERDKIIVGALKECGSEESIEEIFRLHQVLDTKERIEKLNECMGNPQTFFSSDELSNDQKYDLTIRMFLTKSWKLAEYYNRMGVRV